MKSVDTTVFVQNVIKLKFIRFVFSQNSHFCAVKIQNKIVGQQFCVFYINMISKNIHQSDITKSCNCSKFKNFSSVLSSTNEMSFFWDASRNFKEIMSLPAEPQCFFLKTCKQTVKSVKFSFRHGCNPNFLKDRRKNTCHYTLTTL